jgi:hypothetical protein
MINPLECFRSFSYNPGLIKRHNSHKRYGKPTIIPAQIEVQICAENCPAIVLFCKVKGKLSAQKSEVTPKKVAIWQKK